MFRQGTFRDVPPKTLDGCPVKRALTDVRRSVKALDGFSVKLHHGCPVDRFLTDIRQSVESLDTFPVKAP